MRRLVGALVVIALLLCLAPAGRAKSAAPATAGQRTWAVHFTLAPRWLDPAESEGSITPFLTQIQGILFERKIFAPVWENGFIRGAGPRVEEPALSLIPSFPYSAPYEDVRLKP